jgi:hypothetical protein
MSDYDHDFYAWALAQAALLRAGAWTALDVTNLAEEIEDLAKRDRRAVESYLEVILLHLLKWAYQPERRSRSWQKSLLQARHRLAKRLRDNHTLASQVQGLVGEVYPYARRLAALETNLPESTFPSTLRWEAQQVLDEQFLPEADEGQP